MRPGLEDLVADDPALGPASAATFERRWQRVVAEHGSTMAIDVGSRATDFRTLDEDARAFAGRLAALDGWHPGAIVQLDTDDDAYLSRAIGVWLAGGATLPMRPAMLHIDARLARLVEALREVSFGGGDARPTVHELRTSIVVAGLHSIHFTSGSTGTPRAVARGWRQALFEADGYARTVGLEPGRACTMLVAPAFGASTKHLLGGLLHGVRQRVATAESLAPADAHGHVLYATPGQVAACAERLGPVHGYAWISLTGEALTAAGWRGAQALARADGHLLDALGGTEFGVAANSIAPIAGPLPAFRGRALAGKELLLLDDEGTPVRDGEPGRLVVQCDAIAEGYIAVDDEDATRCEPRLTPLATLGPAGAARSTITGDIAERGADGTIRVLGRAGSMLKRHGRWIDVGPLRETLADDARVKAFTIDVAPASAQLRLWIEPARFDPASVGSIARDVERRLSARRGDQSVIPAEIIALAHLPRNRHGKLDLSSLRAADPAGMGAIVERPRSRSAMVAEEILASTPSDAKDVGAVRSLRVFELESIETVELTLELGRRLARQVHLAEVLGEVPLHELRERLVRRSASDASRCSTLGLADAPTLLLWFGEGIGSVVAAVGLECRIIQWDCDSGYEPSLKAAASGVDGLAAAVLSALGPKIESERLVIAGYSYGALVAAACASQCEASGRRVESLHLIDPARRWNGRLRDAWRSVRSVALLSLHGLGLLPNRFRDVASESHRELRVASRRLTIRNFSPTPLRCPVHLVTSPEQHDDVCRRFATISANVTLMTTDAENHNAVVRDRRQVERWLATLADSVRER